MRLVAKRVTNETEHGTYVSPNTLRLFFHSLLPKKGFHRAICFLETGYLPWFMSIALAGVLNVARHDNFLIGEFAFIVHTFPIDNWIAALNETRQVSQYRPVTGWHWNGPIRSHRCLAAAAAATSGSIRKEKRSSGSPTTTRQGNTANAPGRYSATSMGKRPPITLLADDLIKRGMNKLQLLPILCVKMRVDLFLLSSKRINNTAPISFFPIQTNYIYVYRVAG